MKPMKGVEYDATSEYHSITEIPDEVLDCLSKDALLATIRYFRRRHQKMARYTDPESYKPITVLKKVVVEIPPKEANNGC